MNNKEFRSKYFKTDVTNPVYEKFTTLRYYKFKEACFWIVDTIFHNEELTGIKINKKEYYNIASEKVMREFKLKKEHEINSDEWNTLVGQFIHFGLESSNMFKNFE